MKKLKSLMVFLLMGMSSVLWAQTSVTGMVVDDQGLPIPGATVVVKGTSNGTVTDFDGNFSISLENGDILSFSYLGYTSVEVAYTGQPNLSISLMEDAAQLDEVVVIGYGGVKSKDLTGAVKVIGTEDFNKGISNSPGQLLQGKIAGVNVTTGSGEPGSAIDINIRGVNSISGSSNPLFVVDGVPLDGGSSSSDGLEGIGGTSRPKSPLNFINPQDIESITILKDASATAIYGTRASNGVVLITTKKGKIGKTKVTFSTSSGFSTVERNIDLLSASEYREQTARLAPIVGREASSYIDLANAETDWQDEIYRTAQINNYNLGFSGGAGTTTYNVSLGYLDQEGVVKTTGHESFTGRINIGTSLLEDRLKLRANVTVADLTDESQALGSVIIGALRANPTAAVFGGDGEVTTRAGATDNPVSFFDLYRDRAESKKVLANFSTTYTIIEGLDYKLNLGYENSDTDRIFRLFNNSEDGGDITQDQVVLDSREDTNLLVENFLTYKKSYDTWNFDVLAGHSYQTFTNTGLRIERFDFSTTEIDPIYNLGVASQDNTTVSSGNSERKLQSFFGRANANFLDKYLITASFRADASSVFGDNNKYGYFPAVGLGWKINEEAFLKDAEVFSNLKLRLGWGQTGNQAIPVGSSQPSVGTSFNDSFTFDGTSVVNGVNTSRTANPDLKWEVTEQYNVGVDWGILNGKINGSLDYFNKTTTDLFLEVSAPVPALTNSIFINSDAEITNKGFEFALNINAIKTDNFSLDFSGNISFMDNTIEGLETDVFVGGITGPGTSGETSSIFTNGESAGAFFLRRFDGFDAEGLEILSDDPEVVGDALPSTIYGFNINAAYKNFDLALGFNGVGDIDIFNNTARAYSSAASLSQNGNNIFRDYLDVNEGPLIAPVSSSRYIEDGSFFRLNNATLGWNIENKTFLDTLRIYITGQNLFVLTDYTGYDPEINTGGGNVYGVDFGGYPRPTTFLLGLDLSF
ncbi:SusC/RagA family TonB-linked outer membrane protein [Maribacter ulvicola]|uniref:Iron complex outermembrane recepter protein n=1 Tax=Maribacter ulvicola TaxID=228959 RepID=A0A1N6S3P2_9FLAO|nr:SusC/RagA family TonB-linked outer membrane protein [Maribacter ulvicola]SIQ35660.1 iron complex outermembrane recepter protein [Maribacter ulvicola]